MKYLPLILLLSLLVACSQTEKVKFPFHETGYAPPKIVPIGKADTLPLPDSLPHAQYIYDYKQRKLVERDPNIPLKKPKVLPFKESKPKSTGLEAVPITQSLPQPLKGELKARPIGEAKAIPAKGKAVIASTPASLPYTPPSIRDNDRYDIRTFNRDQGLPSKVIRSLLEDSQGRMWIGTFGGLVCLEGGSMKVYTTENGLSGNAIYSLLEDSKGRIWIGTLNSGLNLLEEGKITQYTKDNGLSGNTITSLLEDSKGRIWIGTDKGLNLLEEGKITQYTEDNGLSGNQITSLLEDSEGRIWIGTSKGLNLLEEGKITQYTTDNGLSGNYINSLLEDSKGRIWIGTYEGLNLLEEGKITQYTEDNGLSGNQITSLLEDSEGRIWIGTSKGLNLLEEGKITQYTTDNGLSGNYINSLLEDSKGRIWIGTVGGLSLLEEGKITQYTTDNGLSGNWIESLLEDSKGRIWIGTLNSGLNLLEEGKITQYTTDNGLSFITNLLEDSKGRIWIGTLNSGLNLLEEGKITRYTENNGWSGNFITSLLEDSKGRIWIGTLNSGLNLLEEGKITQYTEDNGLSGNQITSLLEDSKGRIWIGTREGLSLLEEGKITQYTTDNGLSGNWIESLLEDSKGRIWIGTIGSLNLLDGDRFLHFGTAQGLEAKYVGKLAEDSLGNIWIRRDEGLTRMIERESGQFLFENWEKKHGLKSRDILSMVIDQKGTLWLGSDKGLTAFNPTLDTLAPKMFLTGVDIGREAVNWVQPSMLEGEEDTLFTALEDTLVRGNFPPDTSWMSKSGIQWEGIKANGPNTLPIDLAIPYQQNHLTFHYSGMKLDEQEDIVYRYILEGLEDSWSPITKEGKAGYRSIPKGKYTFRVKSRGRNMRWSEDASFSFEVLPPWWSTWQAYAMYALAIFAFAYLATAWRTRNLRAKQVLLEGLIDERTQELRASNEEIVAQRDKIEIERQKSDNLLLNILPLETAQELKEKGYTDPKYYKEATVLFTDFQNFTQSTATVAPDHLIGVLDEYFQGFDAIMDRYGLEKIKTIGDAYMAVAGLPSPDPEHVQHAMDAAWDLLQFVQERLQQPSPNAILQPWDIRIGLHSGEVIAGVIGKKKFAYDIWGDTVNTAARLESGGVAGRINISAATKELLEQAAPGQWRFEYRGEMQAKGKGMVPMYFAEKAGKAEVSI